MLGTQKTLIDEFSLIKKKNVLLKRKGCNTQGSKWKGPVFERQMGKE
jgi:hypothetical protein